ncbi:unnamed protein product, partial [Musa banksii]
LSSRATHCLKLNQNLKGICSTSKAAPPHPLPQLLSLEPLP